jgi:hypothetical protein
MTITVLHWHGDGHQTKVMLIRGEVEQKTVVDNFQAFVDGIEQNARIRGDEVVFDPPLGPPR